MRSSRCLLIAALALAAGACRSPAGARPPVAAPCSPARIGDVEVTGAAPGDVPALAVLQGAHDDPARTARVAAAALEALRWRGHARARIDLARQVGCFTTLRVAVALGPRFRIARIEFLADGDPRPDGDRRPDGGGLPDGERLAALEDALGTVNTVGGVYIEYRLRRALAGLERRYRDAGWLDAKVGAPRAAYDDAAGAVRISIPIEAGRRYRPGTRRARRPGLAARPPRYLAARPPRYLGAEVPAPCTARDVEGCLGWMMERDLAAVELGLYEDARLRGYVQAVVDRLTPASRLARPPRVVIADHHETYATAGHRIVVARTTIEPLGSEAELAGILAHELAHLEAGHVMVSLFGRPTGGDPLADRRDAEAIADERAVWLLERAGYAPAAMGRALRAVLAADDPEHPPRAERIARVDALAGGRAGFEGRAELLGHLDGMVLGRAPRLGHRVDDAWIVPALGVALDLRADDEVRAAGELLALRRGGATVVAYAIGAPWARELAAALEDPQAAATPLGRATAGTVPAETVRDPDDSPLGKLARAIRRTRPQPPPGARVAILERPGGALVIELGPDGGDAPRLPLRAPTEAELVRIRPRRIAIARAARAGTLAALAACPGRLLDDPARRVAAGDPIKCADRPARRSLMWAAP